MIPSLKFFAGHLGTRKLQGPLFSSSRRHAINYFTTKLYACKDIFFESALSNHFFLLPVAKPVFFVLWVLKEQTILFLQIGGCPWSCPETQWKAEIS